MAERLDGVEVGVVARFTRPWVEGDNRATGDPGRPVRQAFPCAYFFRPLLFSTDSGRRRPSVWSDSSVVAFRVRALTGDDAVRIAGWRYDGPWAVYDVAHSDIVVDELGNYSAIVDSSDVLHAFFCVGSSARVPGLEPDPRYVDVGIGLDPAAVGRGRGAALARLAMRHLEGQHPAQRLRAVVQSWNERSLRLARRLGFIETGVHEVGGVDFAVLVTTELSATS